MRQNLGRWRGHGRAALALLWLGMLCAVGARAMPPEVESALQRARVPSDAMSIVLQEAGTGRTVYGVRGMRPKKRGISASISRVIQAASRSNCSGVVA